MGVIYCSACGTQMDSSASFCSKCGAKIYSEPVKCSTPVPPAPPTPPAPPVPPLEKKVTILGYTERFAMNPPISIYSDGVKVGSVARNGRLELKISEPCVLEFKLHMHSTKCFVHPNDVIVLNFDRVWGTLHATVTDKNNSQNVVFQKKEQDNKRTIISILIILGGIPLLGLFILGIIVLLSLI